MTVQKKSLFETLCCAKHILNSMVDLPKLQSTPNVFELRKKIKIINSKQLSLARLLMAGDALVNVFMPFERLRF